MPTVKVSSKYQLLIPKDIREQMNIKPGQQFLVIPIGNHLEFVPLRSPKEMRGFLTGIDTSIPRDEDRL